MVASILPRENASPLRPGEIIWRDRYSMLESHGYRLRQRYKPDWVPSWLTTKIGLIRHEDYMPNTSPKTIDAIRISDGRRVFLKRIPTYGSELAIHRFLSDPQRLQETNNHTAFLLDEFPEDGNPVFTYMVIPLLRLYDEPEFFSVDEVLDFVKQLIEGLLYMHNLDVAHRDCSVLNIMMDADPLYPKGFHPVSKIMDASGMKRAYPKQRRDVGGVRYYFIDFGISSMFPPGQRKKVVGIQGQDVQVPELSEIEPYDPFFTDIFILGNFFRKEFLSRYTNLEFLAPLVDKMTQRNWKNRCTASEAMEMYNYIVSDQSRYTLRWRLKERDAGAVTHFFQDIDSILGESIFLPRTITGGIISCWKAAQFSPRILTVGKGSAVVMKLNKRD